MDRRRKIFQTRVIDNCLDPVWHEEFDITMDDTFETSRFRFEIYDYDIIGDHEFLGMVSLLGSEMIERSGKLAKFFRLGTRLELMEYMCRDV